MNIKRLILIWVMILCLLSAASYADSAAAQSLSSPYYQITESNVAEPRASWAVISHNGNIIAEGTALPYCDVPTLICIEGDILCLRDGGGNAFWFTFYDVAQERISKDYEYVIDLRGENVLYSDLTDGGWRIALANIFSGDILHSVPIDLCTAEGWVQNAEWDEASESWIITYLAGPEYEETRLVFPATANSMPPSAPSVKTASGAASTSRPSGSSRRSTTAQTVSWTVWPWRRRTENLCTLTAAMPRCGRSSDHGPVIQQYSAAHPRRF